jgi:hypothetical protein
MMPSAEVFFIFFKEAVSCKWMNWKDAAPSATWPKYERRRRIIWGQKVAVFAGINDPIASAARRYNDSYVRRSTVKLQYSMTAQT